MPIYEYNCHGDGPFELESPVSEHSTFERCPKCGAYAPRILSSTGVRRIAPSDRIARARNERSQHEPHLVS